MSLPRRCDGFAVERFARGFFGCGLRMTAGSVPSLFNRSPVKMSKDYVVLEKDSVFVTTGREKELLDQFVHREGDTIWDFLDELKPGLVETVALHKQHAVR